MTEAAASRNQAQQGQGLTVLNLPEPVLVFLLRTLLSFGNGVEGRSLQVNPGT